MNCFTRKGGEHGSIDRRMGRAQAKKESLSRHFPCVFLGVDSKLALRVGFKCDIFHL